MGNTSGSEVIDEVDDNDAEVHANMRRSERSEGGRFAAGPSSFPIGQAPVVH